MQNSSMNSLRVYSRHRLRVYRLYVHIHINLSCSGTDLFKRPTKLLYPVDYWSQWPDNSIKDAMEASVTKLESFLGIKRSVINLADRWLEDDPAGNGLALRSYLQDVREIPFHNHPVVRAADHLYFQTFMNLLWKGYYDHFLKFRRDFESKYFHPPYVHPVIQYCW